MLVVLILDKKIRMPPAFARRSGHVGAAVPPHLTQKGEKCIRVGSWREPEGHSICHPPPGLSEASRRRIDATRHNRVPLGSL